MEALRLRRSAISSAFTNSSGQMAGASASAPEQVENPLREIAAFVFKAPCHGHGCIKNHPLNNGALH